MGKKVEKEKQLKKMKVLSMHQLESLKKKLE